MVSVKSKFRVIKEDPKDDMIVNTAFDGKADIIVTGDKHLLRLESFKDIQIVMIETMLNNLKDQT